MTNVTSVTELLSSGCILNSVLVKKEIVWVRLVPDGDDIEYNFNVFVRRLAFADQENILKMIGFFTPPTPAKNADEDDVQPEGKDAQKEDPVMNAALIAAAIRFGEKGDEVLTYQQACNLDPSFAIELIKKIDEVNPPLKKKVNSLRRDVAPVGPERSGGEDYRGGQINSFD